MNFISELVENNILCIKFKDEIPHFSIFNQFGIEEMFDSDNKCFYISIPQFSKLSLGCWQAICVARKYCSDIEASVRERIKMRMFEAGEIL